MTISVGDALPHTSFVTMSDNGPEQLSSESYFKGRRVALFSVPGAFTPTCSSKHLPSYVENADALKACGIDEISCTSVNDAFVMAAWGKANHAEGKVTMLADGNGDFVRALDLVLDGRKFGLGERGQRFSMIINDGIIEQLNLEEPGSYKLSSAEHMLSTLQR